MELYNISDEYAVYLHNFDNKVELNKQERRPYVGIVLTINEFNYFAPLSSPKEKHKKMKNTYDFRKIKNGQLGIINFNTMIPVPDSQLQKICISEILDDKYRILLNDQIRQLKTEQDAIKSTAYNLYNMLLKSENECKPYELRVRHRCCNLTVLEEACKKFEKSSENDA